jgi:hypothetical protein
MGIDHRFHRYQTLLSCFQVSEEGEIALEEGEIEGEVLEDPSPKVETKGRYVNAEPRSRFAGGRGYGEMGGEDRYGYTGRGPGRGRGRGRGDWGRGPENGNMYPDSRAW